MNSSKTTLPRSERRRMKRDKGFHDKAIAGNQHVHPYHRLVSYGKVLVAELLDIQMRMDGVPYSRGRRPIGIRDELVRELNKKWMETVEKLQAVQEDIGIMELNEEIRQHPWREVELYGIC